MVELAGVEEYLGYLLDGDVGEVVAAFRLEFGAADEQRLSFLHLLSEGFGSCGAYKLGGGGD